MTLTPHPGRPTASPCARTSRLCVHILTRQGKCRDKSRPSIRFSTHPSLLAVSSVVRSDPSPPPPVLTVAREVALPPQEAAQHQVHGGDGLVGAPSQSLCQLLQVPLDVLLQKRAGVPHRRLDDAPQGLRGTRALVCTHTRPARTASAGSEGVGSGGSPVRTDAAEATLCRRDRVRTAPPSAHRSHVVCNTSSEWHLHPLGCVSVRVCGEDVGTASSPAH